MLVNFFLPQEDFSNLEELAGIVRRRLTELMDSNHVRQIGYVAGRVTADGEEKIPENLVRLTGFAEAVSQQVEYPVFSAAEVFNTDVYWKINLPHPDHEEAFYEFWRLILGSGVTDVFMSPNWKTSIGAQDEFETASRTGLRIHMMESEERS